MTRLLGSTVVQMMRKHGATVATVAAALQCSEARVRRVRRDGIEGAAYVLDWCQAITGNPYYFATPATV